MNIKRIGYCFLVVILTFIVSACGGGGGGDDGPAVPVQPPNDSSPPVSSTTLTPDTVLVTEEQAKQITETSANDDGTTQLVTTANSDLGQGLSKDNFVLLTGGIDERFPLGLAGKVTSISTDSSGVTSATLSRATFADIVEKSSFQVGDIPLDSSNFVGVIAPKSVRAGTANSLQYSSLTRQVVSSLDGGIVISEPNAVGQSLNSITNVFDITPDIPAIEWNLQFKLDEVVNDIQRMKPWGSGEEAIASITGSMKNLKLVFDYDFEHTALIPTGIKSMNLRLSGDLEFDARIEGGFEADLGYFSQAWKEVDDAAFELLGVSAKLTGLSSKDKIGKFPVAGLVFGVDCPKLPYPCSFLGPKTQTPVRQADKLGVIIWIYLDAHAKFRADGVVGLVKFHSGSLTLGVTKPVDGKLENVFNLTKTGNGRLIEAPFFDADMAVLGRAGGSIDVDFLALGVRIANASSFHGIEGNVAAKGKGGYGTDQLGSDWYWDGLLCAQYSFGSGLIQSASVELGVELDTTLTKEVATGFKFSGTWPNEEERALPGWHGLTWPSPKGTWFTESQRNLCWPGPAVTRITPIHDPSVNSLVVTVDGEHIPEDLQLTVSPASLCVGMQKTSSNETSARFTCQLTSSFNILEFQLASQLAENMDLSAVSDQLNFRIGPNPPRNLTATANDGSVSLSWEAGLGATSYNLFWANSPEISKTTGNKISGIIGTSYVHAGLTNGEDYYYAISAVNEEGESELAEKSGIKATPQGKLNILNDQVLMLSEDDGNWEIYGTDISGSELVNLTGNPADDRTPSLSPDRTLVVFASDRDGNHEIYVMASDGSNQTRLTNSLAEDAAPVWSPDGTQIAFLSASGINVDIYTMDADGGNQLQLTNSSAKDYLPAWSLDTAQIVFVTERDGDEEIYIANTDGTGEKINLTNNSASDSLPSYSPNGDWISFVSDRDGSYDLWLMDFNGANLRKLTDLPDSNVGWYAWSPDGSQIAFDSRTDGDYEVYVVNSDGTGLRKLTDNTVADRFAHWTWDGSKIVFISDRDGFNQIYAMDPDGGNPVNLSGGKTKVDPPMVSPIYGEGGAAAEICPTATAARGSYLEPELAMLRQFRDQYLMKSEAGRLFTKYYYNYAPATARVLAKNEVLRVLTRFALTPVVYGIKSAFPLQETNTKQVLAQGVRSDKELEKNNHDYLLESIL